MFKNYLKIAWRNILRHKVYTSINVLGLALGICACIVIYLITSYELSFDTFHPDKNRIYRVMAKMEFVSVNSFDKFNMNRVPFASVQMARQETTAFETVAAVSSYNAKISIPDNNKAPKVFDSKTDGAGYPGTVVAEPQYFQIFKYKWLAGDPATALTQPFKVVLTQSKALKYFGSLPVNEMIGKEVIYDDSLSVQVSGIVEDWKKNTDFLFTDIISYSTVQNSFLKKIIDDDWGHMSTWAFAKLNKNTNPDKGNQQLAKLVQKYAPQRPDTKLTIWLERLGAVHFDSDVVENPIRTADLPAMYSLIGIALFILVLAIINFINLSTALSIQRAKEIGIRKVLGSRKTGIALQFLVETFIVTFSAELIAVLIVSPVLHAFEAFFPDAVKFNPFNPGTFVFLILVLFITCILAGLYPAGVLSSYLPALSLKGGASKNGTDKWYLRKGLIVFQFTISLIFIISSLVIDRQLQYARNKDMGFNADAIVVIPANRKDTSNKVNILAEKIKQLSVVSNVARQMHSPLDWRDNTIPLKFNSTTQTETRITLLGGNENFIPLYQMKLLAGRGLVSADSLKEFVINNTCAQMLGFKNPGEAVGKMLFYKDKPYPVVGVVSDFNEKSFHEIIRPVCIVNMPDWQRDLTVKLSAGGKNANAITGALAQIEQVWKEVYPGEPFTYSFFDESIERLYEKDYKTAKLMTTAMLITVFISCIGLFGLAMFTAEKRTKEISIRKVLGASVADIATMLSKDFVKLVLIAFIIASPIAWYFMDQWLSDFVYRINLNGWIFMIAGILALFITLITISFQSLKAARGNPVKGLRTE